MIGPWRGRVWDAVGVTCGVSWGEMVGTTAGGHLGERGFGGGCLGGGFRGGGGGCGGGSSAAEEHLWGALEMAVDNPGGWVFHLCFFPPWGLPLRMSDQPR